MSASTIDTVACPACHMHARYYIFEGDDPAVEAAAALERHARVIHGATGTAIHDLVVAA